MNITSAQLAALETLHNPKGLSSLYVSNRTNLKWGRVCAPVANALEKQGLVERRLNPDGGGMITITEAGRDVVRSANTTLDSAR